MRNGRYLLVILFILIRFVGFGQGGGKISGTVVNASNKALIEYASISLVDQKSGKVLNGAITDTKGNFVIKGVAPGTYTVKVDFVGFQGTSKNVVVAGTGNVNAGSISLNPSVASMEAVTVTGSRPLVENHIDKIVFNAAN